MNMEEAERLKTTVTTDRFIKQLSMKNGKLFAVQNAVEVKQASSVNITDQMYNATGCMKQVYMAGWPEESL